jgi:hypothetical protein
VKFSNSYADQIDTIIQKTLEKQSEGLSFNDNFCILLEMRLSGIAKQEYIGLYGKSQIKLSLKVNF